MRLIRALFGSPGNALLTLLLLALLYALGKALLLWALGAQWWVVTENLRYLFVGQLPPELTWRAWVTLLAGLVALAGWLGRLGILPLPKAGWVLVVGIGAGILALPLPVTLWSGLFLSLLLSLSAMALAFPLGVALAFARQSRLVGLRLLAIAYIEAVRGVPLVSLLFLAFVTLPLFLPEDFRLPQVVRALLAFTLFAAAYLAENVRGGLQAVPKGQWEAAHSLGLSSFQAALYVVLPQALRAVVPALVGQFISLFKDTSLVALIGILDLMGVARAVLANPRNVGLEREVYLFLAVVYLVVSGAFSYVGRLVERRMGLGVR
ncbi:amino acid ABC transporter permease [Thermus sp. SYSU G05001]|uniref:Amino acid ABC transporter permease n=1 Tax=Thermus brevis TaxID=2862456 RepID=A0ABS6ZZH9_9DEIN|nr:amino acid ABC transporter permease [Thermus brevis]MBW6394490.1 amino acid ABC transporter permease [Thermus brevis]